MFQNNIISYILNSTHICSELNPFAIYKINLIHYFLGICFFLYILIIPNSIVKIITTFRRFLAVCIQNSHISSHRRDSHHIICFFYPKTLIHAVYRIIIIALRIVRSVGFSIITRYIFSAANLITNTNTQRLRS